MNLKLTRRDFIKGSAAAAAMAAIHQSPLKHVLPKDLGNGFFLQEPIYLGLGTAIPGGIREVSGSGYRRMDMSFEPYKGGWKNADPVTFPIASGPWKISHAAIFAGSELIAVASFEGDYHLQNGDTAQVDNVCIEVGT